jgi:hypothetical protein
MGNKPLSIRFESVAYLVLMMDCLIIVSMYGSLTRSKRFLCQKIVEIDFNASIYLPGAAHSRLVGIEKVALNDSYKGSYLSKDRSF